MIKERERLNEGDGGVDERERGAKILTSVHCLSASERKRERSEKEDVFL